VDKAGFSEKPHKASARPADDIPEALRDSFDSRNKPRKKLVFLVGGLVAASGIALAAGFWYTSTSGKNANSNSVATPSSSSSAAQIPEVKPSASALDNTLLGHLPYSEAPAEALQFISSDHRIKLQQAAAKQFQAMQAAARQAGVILVPISGFRSVKDQQHLFFDIKAQRGQTTTKRAEVSAPPGYSEHHTGYAVDIGDGAVPATNLSPNFEKTKAFTWLSANAAYFSFEMSFPKNNSQGVSYEPWHWRFVGDQQSLETFYKAKSLQPSNAP